MHIEIYKKCNLLQSPLGRILIVGHSGYFEAQEKDEDPDKLDLDILDLNTKTKKSDNIDLDIQEL